MKSERDTPQPQQQATPGFSAAQWGNNQIPIDPALQQQSQPATTPYSHYQHYQHYPQASYGHYSYTQSQPTLQAQPQPATAVTTTAVKQNNQVDTADIATLNDALGSAGVDLRAEEESLHRSYDQYAAYRPYEDRTRKQPAKPNFDTRFIAATMRAIGTEHKVPKIPEDSVNYMALALRTRLQELIKAMIAASAHRTDTQFDRPASLYEDGSPMWSIVVRSDVGKQLAALEKIEREEEMKVRRERKERAEMAAAHAAALAAQAAGNGMAVDAAGEEDGGPKKKKKKEGPGVTARNMSEDVRKKMSNAVASQAAGLGTGKYAWMTAANTSTPAPKPKATTPAANPNPATTTAPAMSNANSGNGWARPYVPTKTSKSQTPTKEEDNRRPVTLRDAMFVIENERGHGGGRGSARGWT